MIKYSESELLDILPVAMKQDSDVQAISYAVKRATEQMLSYAAWIRLYADLDAVPEEILDLIALEMQTQYYDSTLSISVKRELIRNTLAWHASAGTVAAVEELVEVVFGMGTVIEWFDFDEADGEIIPGQFDVKTSAQTTEYSESDFLKIIRKAKKASAHLRRIIYSSRTAESTDYAGCGVYAVYYPAAIWESTE